MKRIGNFFYIGVIAASVVAIIIMGAGYFKDKKDVASVDSSDIQIESIKPKEDKVQVTVDTEILEDGLEGMGILITQEYYFTQIEKYTKKKQIVGDWSSTAEFSYSYDGTVTAGIDFEKISLSCDGDKKIITVKMPDSEIQGVNIDKSTFRKYSEKEYLWNSFNIDDYNMSLVKFEESAKKKALDNGILERSDEQAKNLVQNFLKNFPQIEGYEIVFEQEGGQS